MPRPRAIPAELEPEVYRRSLAGETSQQIADWLEQAHGVTCSPQTVWSCCRRQEARPPDPGRPEPPPDPKAPLEAPTESETLRHLRRQIFDEVKAAEKERDDDWKRYHSALRLALQGDAALIRRTEFDERPKTGEPTAGAGDGATGGDMTQEERDRMVQEAVN